MNDYKRFQVKRLICVKGSYTVEIGLIIPLIMMILVGVIYEAIFQYQRVMVGKTVEMAASAGAALWEQQHKNPVSNDIYWRLFSNWSADEENGDTSQKFIFKVLKDKVKKDLSSLMIKPRETFIEARYTAGFLQPGKITVTARLVYAKPFGLWWEKVLGRKNGEVVYSADCSVTEPAENIRNVDFAFEVGAILAKETGVWDKANDIGDGIKDSIHKKITDIKNSILKRSSR